MQSWEEMSLAAATVISTAQRWVLKQRCGSNQFRRLVDVQYDLLYSLYALKDLGYSAQTVLKF